MKIMLGVDGSGTADAAIEFIARLPRTPDTTVEVVSVVRVPMLAYTEAYSGIGMPPVEMWEEERRHCEVVASKAEDRLRQASIATEAKVVKGDPAEALVSLARQEGIDLLVVGSHGRSGLGAILMGSVASYVVSHAPCAVLVVRAKSHAAERRA